MYINNTNKSRVRKIIMQFIKTLTMLRQRLQIISSSKICCIHFSGTLKTGIFSLTEERVWLQSITPHDPRSVYYLYPPEKVWSAAASATLYTHLSRATQLGLSVAWYTIAINRAAKSSLFFLLSRKIHTTSASSPSHSIIFSCPLERLVSRITTIFRSREKIALIWKKMSPPTNLWFAPLAQVTAGIPSETKPVAVFNIFWNICMELTTSKVNNKY